MDQHVIICGYGRTGERVASFLSEEAIPFVALDLNPATVKQAPPAHGVLLFGSADRAEVLKAAGLSRARGVVVTYHDTQSAERVVRLIRQDFASLPIVVRVAEESAVARLKAAGATEVVPEMLEGSLMIAAEALVQFGIPVEQAMRRVRSVRAERYASLRAFYDASAKPDKN